MEQLVNQTPVLESVLKKVQEYNEIYIRQIQEKNTGSLRLKREFRTLVADLAYLLSVAKSELKIPAGGIKTEGVRVREEGELYSLLDGCLYELEEVCSSFSAEDRMISAEFLRSALREYLIESPRFRKLLAGNFNPRRSGSIPESENILYGESGNAEEVSGFGVVLDGYVRVRENARHFRSFGGGV